MQPLERWPVANGLRHHALVWNDSGAETILCCHGYLDLAWSFRPLAERLADAGHRVVAFDWRGHGETDPIGPGGYYHFADYVLDLHQLLPSLVNGQAHLLGHSMGGTAAAYYAATHPGVLESLTLVEGLGPPSWKGHPADKLRAWLDSVDRHLQRPPRPLRDLDDAVRRIRVHDPDLPTELAYELAEKATLSTEDGLHWRFDRLHRTTLPSVFSAATFMSFLARIDAPTLIVQGDRGFRTADHAERRAAIRDVREETLPGVGHMLHRCAPSELAELVLAHVRSAG